MQIFGTIIKTAIEAGQGAARAAVITSLATGGFMQYAAITPSSDLTTRAIQHHERQVERAERIARTGSRAEASAAAVAVGQTAPVQWNAQWARYQAQVAAAYAANTNLAAVENSVANTRTTAVVTAAGGGSKVSGKTTVSVVGADAPSVSNQAAKVAVVVARANANATKASLRNVIAKNNSAFNSGPKTVAEVAAAADATATTEATASTSTDASTSASTTASTGASSTEENTAPTADAGANQTVVLLAMVQLDGSGSSDTDGGSLTYTWDLVSSPAGSSATLNDITASSPVFTADVAGTYALTLTVTASEGNTSASDAVTVTSGCSSSDITLATTAGAVSTHATIQAALDAATGGDSITVGTGTFTEDLDINGKTNLTVQTGCGAVVSGTVQIRGNSDSVTIDGFTIDANEVAGSAAVDFATNAADNIALKNCTVQNTAVGQDAIAMNNNNSGLAVDNCTVTDAGGVGVSIGTNTVASITNSDINTNAGVGIDIHQNSGSVAINDSSVTDNGGYGVKRGTNVADVTDVTLTNLTLKNKGGTSTGNSSADLGNHGGLLDASDTNNTTTSGSEGTGVTGVSP